MERIDHYAEYRAKLRTPEEAVKVIKSGDWVDYMTNVTMPVLLDKALAKRRDELTDVKIRGNLIFGPIEAVECDPKREHFIYNSWHCSSYERKLCDRGLCNFIPMVFHNVVPYYRHFLTVNVAMMCVTPMDRHGYFNLSSGTGVAKGILEKADIVILPGFPYTEPTPEDMAIAKLIIPYIKDGATIQLGIGSMPNAVGSLIADSDLRDLGMHTELLSDAYLELHRAGKLTNRKKKLHRDKGVAGITIGSQDLYGWVDRNPGVVAMPLEYVNAPEVIGQHDDMISISSGISVDLFGQVCAESAGLRHISGTGGQLDFLVGASMSKGGKAFICMSSTFKDRGGRRHSRIVPYFMGDIVTDPRSQAYHVVTEYGCVNLVGRTTWERSEMLISIAHPDFREDLIREAELMKIWRPSNKKP